jgi:hypothetical protein
MRSMPPRFVLSTTPLGTMIAASPQGKDARFGRHQVDANRKTG